MVRWNTNNETWQDDLPTIGNVQRVNAQLLGDCFPLNSSSCEMWVAYGNNIMRRFQYSTMTLLDEWSDFPDLSEGWRNSTASIYSQPWKEYTDGTQSMKPLRRLGLRVMAFRITQKSFFSMEIVGDDLWVASHRQGSWNSNAQILTKNGTTGNWSVWDLGSGDIPGGYGADILVCDEIITLPLAGSLGGVTKGGSEI